MAPRGGVAWATITDAQPKRRMGRGGKLDVNIDTLRLKDGEKIALRAVKDTKGGGHVGAMTGAMVATGIVFSQPRLFFSSCMAKILTFRKVLKLQLMWLAISLWKNLSSI